jgi:putative SOS response-associated peptidase YedK
VILDPEVEETWIADGQDPAALRELMRPLRGELFDVREVSDAVNDVREDGPHLLEPPLRLF